MYLTFIKRHALIFGIILMFLLTWPFVLANAGVLPFQVPFIVGVSAGWGLSIAALIMTGLTLGRSGVVTLLKRFLIWRVNWKWYLIAFFLFPTIFIFAVLFISIWTGKGIDFSSVMAHKIFGANADLLIFILPFFIFDLLTNGEELGWRGYVLPRLQAKYSAWVASLILGVVWGLWHLPLFIAGGNFSLFLFFMFKVTADAVIYTWVYNNTKGSLLLTTILHAAGNTAGVFLPTANTQTGEHLDVFIVAIVILILTAVTVTVAAGPTKLSRAEEKQRQD